MGKTYKFLSPYTFKNGLEVKNRIIIPPMTIGSSLQNGTVSTEEVKFYEKHTGGAGMYILPATSVTALGKGFEGQPSISEDRFIPGFSRMATAVQKNDTKAVLQLIHVGRMTSSLILRGQQPVAPSSIPAARHGAEIPRALSHEEILGIIDDFSQATRRAIEAGFDGVELHGANTYLLQQFFSPHSNSRTDQWGGNIENRMRFPLAVIRSVLQVVEQYASKPFIVGYRLSPEELEEPGIRLADTLTFIDVLANEFIDDLDYIHISLSDAFATSKNDLADQVPIILQIKEVIAGRLPLIALGGIETPQQAERVREAGLDFVGIGRAIIRDPEWVQKVEAGQENQIRESISPQQMEESGINPAIWDLLQMLHFDSRDKGE